MVYEFIYRWFVITTAHHPEFGLGKQNIECYENAIAHLKETIQLFSLINVGNQSQ